MCIITVTVWCVVVWLVAVCTVSCIGNCIACGSNTVVNCNSSVE